jgi:hypothetical protein
MSDVSYEHTIGDNRAPSAIEHPAAVVRRVPGESAICYYGTAPDIVEHSTAISLRQVPGKSAVCHYWSAVTVEHPATEFC